MKIGASSTLHASAYTDLSYESLNTHLMHELVVSGIMQKGARARVIVVARKPSVRHQRRLLGGQLVPRRMQTDHLRLQFCPVLRGGVRVIRRHRKHKRVCARCLYIVYVCVCFCVCLCVMFVSMFVCVFVCVCTYDAGPIGRSDLRLRVDKCGNVVALTRLRCEAAPVGTETKPRWNCERVEG